jgi:hypothetical protein
MVGALTTLAVAAVAAACGSFGSDEATGANPDGGGGGQEGAPSDAPDAGEAGADASADAASCAVLLEEHFTGDLNTSSWARYAPSPSVVSLDKALGNPTAPSLFATGTVTAAKTANASIDQTVFFDGGVGTVTLDFGVTIEAPDGGPAYAELGCEAVFRNAKSDQTIAALSRYTSGELAGLVEPRFAGGPSLGDSFVQHHSAGWHRVRIITTAAATTSAVITYEVDGMPQTMAPTSALTAPLPPGTDRVQVVCGLVYANLEKDASLPSSFLSVHVDDVILTRCAP